MNGEHKSEANTGRTVGIYFSPEVEAKAKENAKALCQGNMSRYIADLIANDSVGERPNPVSEDCFRQLVSWFAPALADDVGHWAREFGTTERRFMGQLVYELALIAAENEATPEQLLTKIKEVQAWQS